jgi:hypothetical protein
MIIASRVVPTEYDVERDNLGRHILIDDRARRFVGWSLPAAYRKAESQQNPSDPMHHEPYPDRSAEPIYDSE